jgi:hypothetical protein
VKTKVSAAQIRPLSRNEIYHALLFGPVVHRNRERRATNQPRRERGGWTERRLIAGPFLRRAIGNGRERACH